jgi:pimeloyl-ACP methyl ester carboxylesterase
MVDEQAFEKADEQAVDEDGFPVVDETPEFEAAVEQETQAKVDANHPDGIADTSEGLSDVTLVGQDWGGVLGFPVAVLDHPDRFARLVPMNTGVPTGQGEMIDAWWMFREYMVERPDPSISTVVRALGDMANFHERAEQPEPWVAPVERGGAGLDLSPEVAAAYDAPFHTPEAKAGARQWPSLVPTDSDMEGADIGMQTIEALGD